jgi:hypothetical protein
MSASASQSITSSARPLSCEWAFGPLVPNSICCLLGLPGANWCSLKFAHAGVFCGHRVPWGRVYRPVKLWVTMIRSYDPEYTPSRPIWEVKQDSARPVLRTEMTREALVTNLLPPFCTIRPCGRDCPRNRREKRANEAVFRGPSPAVGAPGRVRTRAPVRVAPIVSLATPCLRFSFESIKFAFQRKGSSVVVYIAAPAEGYVCIVQRSTSEEEQKPDHLRVAGSGVAVTGGS